ncbi:hypothetical protein [Terriglobus sp.]|uniref:hypothetical protein n=1 Tax=Terriglobus sp. TaxID=1889013 RepID=UPI003AFFA5BF
MNQTVSQAKILTMPARSAAAAPAGVPVYGTEGNLATAVAYLHASADPGSQQGQQPVPVPRSPLRVVITPQTAFYRKYTEAMLRRYAAMRLQKARVPSLLGRELFRGKVTSYRVHGFDDVIIFVTDVERCILLLTPEQQRLIVRVAVQEYTLAETASMLRWSFRSTQRRYHEALDELTAIFQKRGLMQQTPGISTDLLKSCQEAKQEGVAVTYLE